MQDFDILIFVLLLILQLLLMQASNTEFVRQYKPGFTNQQWSELKVVALFLGMVTIQSWTVFTCNNHSTQVKKPNKVQCRLQHPVTPTVI